MILARAVFCLSITATLFWVLGFAAEKMSGTEPPFWSYTGTTILLASACAFFIFRSWPQFLVLKPGATALSLLRSFAVWTLLAYVVGVLVVGVIAYFLLNPSGQPSETMRTETSLLAFMLSLWLPLWFAPAVGVSLGWWRNATNAP